MRIKVRLAARKEPTLPTQIFPGLTLLRGEGNGVSGYTLLLQRQEGNLVVYNGGTLDEISDTVTKLGGLAGLFINDRHNAKVADDITAICRHYGASFYASEIEAKVASIKQSPVLSPIKYHRQMFGSDFEIMPLPGHTPGNLAFRWHSGKHKILFIGDTLVPDNGEWKFWVSKPNVKTMIEGLEMLKATEFNVIISTSFGCRGGNVFELTPRKKTDLLDTVIAALRKKGRS